MIAAPAAAPPTPPGRLGKAAAPKDVLTYLAALTRWRDQAQATLDRLDQRSQAAGDPDAYVADVTLAFALWQAVATRVDELVATWDSGRVGHKELETFSSLAWGRLDEQASATGFAVTFPEACTLLDALVGRLGERLETDALARVGDVLARVGDQLTRCESLARTLGEHEAEVRPLRARYDAAVAAGKAGTDVADELAALDAALAPIDRDLVVADAVERSIAQDQVDLAHRLEVAGRAEAEARVLARSCTEKVLGAPRLAVPAVAVIGPVPPPTGDRTARRAALDAYGERLHQVERALAEVHRRYAAPLERRTELRGLLGAYREMAGRHKVAEDPTLIDAHAAARAELWRAPCDLDVAAHLVDAYRDAVHARTGRTH